MCVYKDVVSVPKSVSPPTYGIYRSIVQPGPKRWFIQYHL